VTNGIPQAREPENRDYAGMNLLSVKCLYISYTSSKFVIAEPLKSNGEIGAKLSAE